MLLNDIQVEQAQSRRELEVAERVRARQLRSQLAAKSVRRAVGRSMISIGSRLAAEPQPQLARSR
jgi:hypothetical protein